MTTLIRKLIVGVLVLLFLAGPISKAHACTFTPEYWTYTFSGISIDMAELPDGIEIDTSSALLIHNQTPSKIFFFNASASDEERAQFPEPNSEYIWTLLPGETLDIAITD